MIDIQTLTLDAFRALPLVIKGESKEVRYAGNGQVVIWFIPTIYSFTHNRCAWVEGSNKPRIQMSKLVVKELRKAGIRHAYREFSDEFVLADLVMPHEVEFRKYGLSPFVPQDLTPEQIDALPKAPPIEIIAKCYLSGTPKYGCVGMAGSLVRASRRFSAGKQLKPDGALPELLIRFDWRNPLNQAGKGKRMAEQILADAFPHPWLRRAVCTMGAPIVRPIVSAMERFGDRCQDAVLPEQLADLFTDVKQARTTAFMTAMTLKRYLAEHDIVFYDLCLFIDESGTLVYGEISPDCGRYRHLDLGHLDKDVWRTGGSSREVVEKWMLIVELLRSSTLIKKVIP